MGKCFIKKLLCTVSGDMPVLGGIVLNVKNTDFSIARLGGYDSEHPAVVSIKDGDIYDWQMTTQYSNPYNAVGNNAIGFKPTADTTVTIQNKDNIANFSITKYDISGSNSVVNRGFFYGTINTEDFVGCEHLVNFNNVLCDIVGTVNDFAKAITLNSLQIGCGKVEGDLVQLVKDWIANGRNSSGSMNVQINRRNSDLFSENDIQVTFNGIRVSPMWADGHLVWESNTKIYLDYIKDSSNTPLVYCIGYSDAEIAAKTASGGDWENMTVVKADE